MDIFRLQDSTLFTLENVTLLAEACCFWAWPSMSSPSPLLSAGTVTMTPGVTRVCRGAGTWCRCTGWGWSTGSCLTAPGSRGLWGAPSPAPGPGSPTGARASGRMSCHCDTGWLSWYRINGNGRPTMNIGQDLLNEYTHPLEEYIDNILHHVVEDLRRGSREPYRNWDFYFFIHLFLYLFIYIHLLIQYFSIFWSLILVSLFLCAWVLSNYLVDRFFEELWSTFPDNDRKRSIKHGHKTIFLLIIYRYLSFLSYNTSAVIFGVKCSPTMTCQVQPYMESTEVWTLSSDGNTVIVFLFCDKNIL